MARLSKDGPGFRHEALMYAGDDGFLEGTVPFIRGAVEAGEPILVVVGARKIEMLRAELDGDADAVMFADMAEVGANPARIIPAWREFVDERSRAGGPMRGIGEPIWADRGPPELVECQRHEELLNLAFADGPDMRLLCPYDTSSLDEAVIEEARRSHPVLIEDGDERESPRYRGLEAVSMPFARPLPPPPPDRSELIFDAHTLDSVRRFLADTATAAGMEAARVDDLVLAVNELATNSVRHAGGEGVLSVWRDSGALLCEVRDDGRILQPLVGRVCPTNGQIGGYGLWLVNQVCDLVQVRTFATESVVRVHMRLPAT